MKYTKKNRKDWFIQYDGYGSKTKMKNDSSYCTVVALSAAFEIPFDDAHVIMRLLTNRKNRCGTHMSDAVALFRYNEFVINNKSFAPYTEIPNKTLKQLLETNPKFRWGTWIFSVRSHVYCVKHGKIESVTCEALGAKVIFAYRLKTI